MSLEADIRNSLNYHSAENASDTPDFVLAAYLLDCLAAWNKAIKARVAACPPPGPPRQVGPGEVSIAPCHGCACGVPLVNGRHEEQTVMPGTVYAYPCAAKGAR